jgi:hypothetical protein
VIAIGGSWGTLSEIALAKRRGGIPVVCLDGWRITDHDGTPIEGIAYVDSPSRPSPPRSRTPPGPVTDRA